MTQALASRFAPKSPTLRSDHPLSDHQIAAVAPSIFAEAAHDSRSERYAYIATRVILDRLRLEGFQPFMVAQTRVRNEGRRDYTKHMLRLRPAGQIDAGEAKEIILLNSHDGTSSYQMLAGMFRFVCKNGLVVGDTIEDVRIPHKGDVALEVVQTAHTILERFRLAEESRDTMRTIELAPAEATVLACAALQLRYDDPEKPAPVTEAQVLTPRRWEDRGSDLWSVFNRLQENLVRGGLAGRSTNGRNTQTREVRGIDQNVKLNRALWTLAEGMRALKA
jgi:hypothetical protein